MALTKAGLKKGGALEKLITKKDVYKWSPNEVEMGQMLYDHHWPKMKNTTKEGQARIREVIHCMVILAHDKSGKKPVEVLRDYLDNWLLRDL